MLRSKDLRYTIYCYEHELCILMELRFIFGPSEKNRKALCAHSPSPPLNVKDVWTLKGCVGVWECGCVLDVWVCRFVFGCVGVRVYFGCVRVRVWFWLWGCAGVQRKNATIGEKLRNSLCCATKAHLKFFEDPRKKIVTTAY